MSEYIFTIVIIAAVVGIIMWKKLVKPSKFVIKEYERGVLFRQGKIAQELGPGAYTLYAGSWRQEEVVVTDTRETSLVVSGQEVLTTDSVWVKFNVLVQYKIIDAKSSLLKLSSLHDKLYQSVQLHLRSAVAGMALSEVVSGRNEMNTAMKAELQKIMQEYGIEVLDARVKDVSLDADMRAAMSGVVKAQKEAQAALESAREKVASARALANAAQIMKENPEIYKLKQLDILQKAAEKSGHTFVIKLSEGDDHV